MSEHISKEEINRVLLNRIDMNNKCLSGARESKHFEEEKYFSTLIFEDEQIKALIEESAPSADVRENIHGHWERDTEIDGYRCSNCGSTGMDYWNGCPYCLADMRESKGLTVKVGIVGKGKGNTCLWSGIDESGKDSQGKDESCTGATQGRERR